eukprot:gene23418-31762_t
MIQVVAAYLLIHFSVAFTATPSVWSEAQDLYNNGMAHIQEEDLVSGVAFIRAACRKFNSSALLWNDLGVTEMRLQEWERALRHFRRALQIDPTFKTARDNIIELRTFNLPTGYYYNDTLGIEYEDEFIQEHRVLSPPEVSVDDLLRLWQQSSRDEDTDSERATRLQDRFFVVRGLLNGRDYRLDTSAIYRKVDASDPGTYIQWNMDAIQFKKFMNLSNAILPSIFDEEYEKCLRWPDELSDFYLRTHWKMLLIAEKGGGMFNHKDTLHTSSWQIQLVGQKKWHICPPSQDEFMYDAGDVDFFRPNYFMRPLARNATCYQVTLSPGDFLYYPPDYWHQTVNLDTPTVALTGTLITSSNYALVAEQLRKDCIAAANPSPSDARFCELVDSCFVYWNQLYTVDEKDRDDCSSPNNLSCDNICSQP